MELSFYRTRVYEDAFMTGDALSLFRYRFPPGATHHNASGMASLGASSIKIASPALFEELTFKRRINEQKKNTSFGQNQGLVWSSDSSLWENQLLERKHTSFGQNQGLVWSFDPSLWGNQQLTHKKI